jgi:CHASE3 domain sensor protein
MTEEDEAFEQIEKAQGWRKRHVEETIKYRDAFPREPYVMPISRNDVLEEVACEIDKMQVFEKDTMASIAAYVRNMKDAKTKTS